jgi:predicted dienelactone hydrolase
MPVILFSHGLGGTRDTYEYLGRQWAAHGYVVIHLQHPGSDDSAWRGQQRPMQSMVEAANLQNALDRDQDVKFVLDQLEALNRNDPKLKGLLDLKLIGMAGHSFGAQTTLLVAGQKLAGGRPIAERMLGDLSDPRIKAVIPMSAGIPATRANLDGSFAAIRIPIFYMTGTRDDSPIGDIKAADRRLAYEHTRGSSDAYLLTFNGGDHMVFSGRLSGAGREKDATFQKHIRIASTAFWDAYLKNDAAARSWLKESFSRSLGGDGTFEQK